MLMSLSPTRPLYPTRGRSAHVGARTSPRRRTTRPCRAGRPTLPAPSLTEESQRKGAPMLWLILAVVLLVIAIAGGAIIHPLLFILGILALVVFFVGARGSAL